MRDPRERRPRRASSPRVFDGFSIGSNDLTQLALGVDRDSETVAPLFDERNAAVLDGRRRDRRGPSGRPQDRHLRPGAERLPGFAAFLVERGIDPSP